MSAQQVHTLAINSLISYFTFLSRMICVWYSYLLKHIDGVVVHQRQQAVVTHAQSLRLKWQGNKMSQLTYEFVHAHTQAHAHNYTRT